jgi:hypothetical protein
LLTYIKWLYEDLNTGLGAHEVLNDPVGDLLGNDPVGDLLGNDPVGDLLGNDPVGDPLDPVGDPLDPVGDLLDPVGDLLGNDPVGDPDLEDRVESEGVYKGMYRRQRNRVI